MHPEQLTVPVAVAYAACLAFSFAGLVIIAKRLGLTRCNAWLVVFVIAAMLALEVWISFGSGSRRCSVSIPFFGGIGSELVCRGVFGLGTILVALMLGWAIVSAYRTKAG